ncbi:MAG: hypothetical protein JW795_17620, partial [Chitinivibrionales bacterium]|nr:hypothetical protein [Chitinivibrionales bacterium]
MKKRKKNTIPSTSGPVVKTEALTQAPVWYNRISVWHYIAGFVVLWMLFHHRILLSDGHLWEDIVNFEFPNRVFSRDSFLGLHFPHWDPNTFCGMPFFASTHTAVLYPTNILLSLCSADRLLFWYLIQVAIIVHFLIGGITMFFYLQNRAISKAGSFFSATGYMFCGFFVTHVVHPMMIYIIAWLPLVLLFLEKGMRRKHYRWFVYAGLTLGVSTLAGHPQLTFYEFLFLGAYSIYLWFAQSGKNGAVALYCAGSFAGAICIASVLYLPAQELSENSVRTLWSFDEVSEGSFRFIQLLTLFMPKFFGSWTGPDSAAAPFWLPGPKFGYFTYWDTCFYTGIALLLFAIVQLWFDRKSSFARFCLIWMALSLAIALGSHFFLYKLLYLSVPGFNKFRAPARILFTWNLLIPILAASTFDRLFERGFLHRTKKIWILCLVFFLVISIIGISGMLQYFFPGIMDKPQIAEFSAIQGWLFLLNIALLASTLWIISVRPNASVYSKILLITVSLIDLFTFGINHHITRKNTMTQSYAQDAAAIASLHREASEGLFRINSRQFLVTDTNSFGNQTPLRIFERNQGMIDHIQLLEGYNPYNLYRRLPPGKGPKQFDRML